MSGCCGGISRGGGEGARFDIWRVRCGGAGYMGESGVCGAYTNSEEI